MLNPTSLFVHFVTCVGLMWAVCTSESFAQPAGARRLPDSVERIADIPYAGTDNPRQTLDLLLPNERGEEPLPVIVYVHGGAWLGGDKRFGLPRVAPLVDSGQYAAATVGYRLSGEAKWPSQIHDVKAAVRWIRANARKHGLDPDRIGAWGESAGGHLVAILGTSGDVPEMDGQLGPHTDVASRVTCVVNFFGPTDFLQMNAHATAGSNIDHESPDSPVSRLLGGPVLENRDKVQSANPITYVTADDPPMLLVHGTADPLVPHHQSQLLDDALAEVEVASTLITVEGGGHGAGFGRQVQEAVSSFFDHHLRSNETEWEDTTIQASDPAPARRR